jgi:hypothetical protein
MWGRYPLIVGIVRFGDAVVVAATLATFVVILRRDSSYRGWLAAGLGAVLAGGVTRNVVEVERVVADALLP